MAILPACAQAEEGNIFPPPSMDFMQLCKKKETERIKKPTPSGEKIARARHWLETGNTKENKQAAALLEEVIISASPGHRAKAKFHLAKLLLAGDGVTGDEVRAVRLLEEALPHDTYAAGMALGDYHTDRDRPAEAEEYYRRAAAAGNSRAYLMLSRFYRHHLVPAPSPAAAQEMLTLAQNLLLQDLAQGRCGALRDIGAILLSHGLGARDEKTAILWLEAAVQTGDVPAMLLLADIHSRRMETKQDKEQARRLWEKAAITGNAEAMYRLSEVVDPETRTVWLEQAARKGHRQAAGKLIEGYQGSKTDEEKARYWLQQAAEAGDASGEQLLQLAELTKKSEEKFILFREAAMAGSREALVRLGDAYKFGQGVPADPIKSYRFYRLAAGEGNRDAMMALEENYRCGIGKEENRRLARRWLNHAVLEGSAAARKREAIRLMISRKEKDRKAAIKLLQGWEKEEAIRLRKDKEQVRNPVPQVLLAVAYAHGIGVIRNAKQAAKWEARAIAPGKSQKRGMLALAEAYRNPALMGVDAAKASNLLRRAAALGSGKALRELGAIYEKGDLRITRNTASAENYYRKAITAEDPEAMSRLGNLLLHLGRKAEGLEWLRKAADREDASAMIALARHFANGNDPAARKEAEAWLQKAENLYPCSADARQDMEKLNAQLLPKKTVQELERDAAEGNAAAMRMLGKHHLFQGNTARALTWYERAAEAGDAQAMLELGNLYFIGSGIEISKERAIAWWRGAAKAGNEEAVRLLKMNRLQN